MNSVKTKIKEGGIYTKRNKATDGQGQSKRSKAKDDQVKTQDDQDACHDTVLGCDVIPTIDDGYRSGLEKARVQHFTYLDQKRLLDKVKRSVGSSVGRSWRSLSFWFRLNDEDPLHLACVDRSKQPRRKGGRMKTSRGV